MAEAAAERRGLVLPRSRVEAEAWARAHADVLALVGIMFVAALLRFWDLGSRALHHDESLHAQFSWYLYEGRGYIHDPLMHGTFLFHANALVYFLFGATDFTSRVVPALFGVALVGMPFFLRRYIGMKAVLIAAVLLTFSPTLLYFGRFIRNDIYVAVWTLAIVICIWRYLHEQRPLYLYLMAFFMAVSFATKEVTFIVLAVLLLFVNGMLAIELGRRQEGEDVSDVDVRRRTLLLLPFAWLVAAGWPLLSRRPFGRDSLPVAGDVMVVLGTLTLPQFAAAVQVIPQSFGQRLASIFDPVPLIGSPLADLASRVFVGNQGYRAPAEDDMRIITVLVLLIVSAYVGLLWRPKVWALAAAAIFIPFVLLFTTFLTNTAAPWTSDFWAGKSGFWSGIWGSLDYWLDQHHVKRGDQPRYYYALLTPLYEFLPLVLALGGAAWLALKGDSLRRWLLFWVVGIFVGLSLAGEKMPWLEVHIAVPLVLIAAVSLTGALDWLGFTAENWRKPAAVGVVAGLAVILVVADTPAALSVAGWALIGGALLAIGEALWNEGRLPAARMALAAFVALLFALTVRAGTMASFEHGDIPVEMLVYTQTSPQIPEMRDRIDALARETGLGKSLPIVVDGADGFAWPWAWYLRDYKAVSYATITRDYRPPEDAVLLIAKSNVGLIDPAGYSTTPYRHRWWFPETYRNLTLSKVVSIATSPSELKELARFFLYRRSPTISGSVDAVAFFPESLAGSGPAASAQPPREPVTLTDGRIVIGAPGAGRGEFSQPAGVFVDTQGNIWVADSKNNRIQKFDASGRFVAAIVRTRENQLRFGEPWGVVVAPDGRVYVADTWNDFGKIQMFTPELKLVKVWGQSGGGRPDPGPTDYFGPRDAAIAPDGTLWITDTGHKRLVQYSRDGDPIAAFGGPGSAPGQFEEPVGLAFDRQGNLYVADAWNGRIQKFGPGFVYLASFGTGWTSREVTAKPYLAVLSDGRVIATDPVRGLLLLFDASGALVGTWQPEPDSYPVGVAATPDGGFVFSELRKEQVQVVPGALVGRLFQ